MKDEDSWEEYKKRFKRGLFKRIIDWI